MKTTNESKLIFPNTRHEDFPPYFNCGSLPDSCLSAAVANGINVLTQSPTAQADDLHRAMGLRGCTATAFRALKPFQNGSTPIIAREISTRNALRQACVGKPTVISVNQEKWFKELAVKSQKISFRERLRSLFPAFVNHAILVYKSTNEEFTVFDANFSRAVIVPREMLRRVASKAISPIQLTIKT